MRRQRWIPAEDSRNYRPEGRFTFDWFGMQERLAEHEIVLVGAGHTNAHILRMWRMNSIPNARLTCISDSTVAAYSGMLPGVLAGLYREDQFLIDLVRLCASVRARLVVGEVEGIDHSRNEILIRGRPAVPFDVLSIGIGSVPNREELQQWDETLVPIKPMQTFLSRLDNRLRVAELRRESPVRVAVVGGGAAGIEIALAVGSRVQRLVPGAAVETTIYAASDHVGVGLNAKMRRLINAELERRKIASVLRRRVCRTVDGRITLDDGTEATADVVLWATNARPPKLLSALGLPLDERGFLKTDETLRTTSGQPIFAVGDTGTIHGTILPKAGVYAVRQGPVLWHNLREQLAGRQLRHYQPQRDFLKLLSTGDQRAVFGYHGFAAHAPWCWRLKNWIDRRFMEKYQRYESPAEMAGPVARRSDSWSRKPGAASDQPAVRCTGCGGKVGADILRDALAGLETVANSSVVIGLDQPDDVAVVRLSSDLVSTTVDFFAPPFDDPFTSGRLAALNALSDVYVSAAEPVAALAIVTIPVGPATRQRALLHELLAGAMLEFRAANVSLVGGHTTESTQITIGFSILANTPCPPALKGNLRPQDTLILTKPLGTGSLLAAHMRAGCHETWYRAMLESMLQSNRPAAEIAQRHGVTAMTDITGFGLAGHLLEMLRASDCQAELNLKRIPLLPGAYETLRQGIESTLAPSNRLAERDLVAGEPLRRMAEYKAIFDPQTSGGLLLAVTAGQEAAVLQQLAQAGFTQAAAVGRILARTSPTLAERLVVKE